jgi:hypothetical protein
MEQDEWWPLAMLFVVEAEPVDVGVRHTNKTIRGAPLIGRGHGDKSAGPVAPSCSPCPHHAGAESGECVCWTGLLRIGVAPQQRG